MIRDQIYISSVSDRSMYLQIMDQLKRLIAGGVFKPGEEIPSIRSMALELQVSVITVKRAYLELERAGIITTRQGKGCFVAGQLPSFNLELKREEMRRYLLQGAESARSLGLGKEEAVAEFGLIFDSTGGLHDRK